MNIKTMFDILEKVTIVELGIQATVLNIEYDGIGLLYRLEYWWEGEIKCVKLYENELAALKSKESAVHSTNSASRAIALCDHALDMVNKGRHLLMGESILNDIANEWRSATAGE